MTRPLICLGLESSCDETAAAVVRVDGDTAHILSNVIFDQAELHTEFGGVVPEIAARAHAERMDICAKQALDQAQTPLADMDVIAVTAGPGLIGGVMAGVMCAKGIATGSGKPLVGVNHLAGHALTAQLTHGTAFPYLLLLVSGGHCQFLVVEGADQFRRLGGTIDDAPGEAFDKTARVLGLPQPGGPSVEQAAINGDATRFALPRPLLDRDGIELSFSGLKTALIRARDGVTHDNHITSQDVYDLCAGFQAAVCDVLAEKTRRAMAMFLDIHPTGKSFAVAGGVAANKTLRACLETVSRDHTLDFIAPPLALCTDNAAMIAFAGLQKFRLGQVDDMTLRARPRWPLDNSQSPLIGSGKKGPKA